MFMRAFLRNHLPDLSGEDRRFSFSLFRPPSCILLPRRPRIESVEGVSFYAVNVEIFYDVLYLSDRFLVASSHLYKSVCTSVSALDRL